MKIDAAQNPLWVSFLLDFLLDLADVYEETDSFNEMKLAIEESLSLAKILGDRSLDCREVRAIKSLSCLADNTNDKESAL